LSGNASRPRTVAIIQARMGSSRLPGKVMRVLAGRSVLAHVVERVRLCLLVDEVVVATTTSAADEAIVAEAQKLGVRCFRGSEEDVLARYYAAARDALADVVVRATSDCPLFDPELLEHMLRQFRAAAAAGEPLDYLSNTLERSYPRGLDAEIFTFAALERAHREARAPAEREHVTPYLYRHPERFHVRGVKGERDLSRHRWTLDTPEDWAFISAVFEQLGKQRFGMEAVLEVLERRPELLALNAHVKQKALGE
jgi:spore coat polysaccharide biosynthesis protein SpsF